MYKIYLINFRYYKDTLYPTLDAAIAAAKDTGFECSLWCETNGDWDIVGTWSPISGLKLC